MAQETVLFQGQGAVHAGLVAVAEAQHVLGVGVAGRPGCHVGQGVRQTLGGDVVDVLIRNREAFPHAVAGAVGAGLVNRHVGAPDQQQFGVLRRPTLLLGIGGQVAAGLQGGVVVVGAECHASGVGSVVGDAGDPGVVEDAGDQVLGAGDPVCEDHSVNLLGDQEVGAFHGSFLVVGVVAVDNLHPHLGGDGVDVVGHAVGERDTRQAVTVTDLPRLLGRTNFGFVRTGWRLRLLFFHRLLFRGFFDRSGRRFGGGGGGGSFLVFSAGRYQQGNDRNCNNQLAWHSQPFSLVST